MAQLNLSQLTLSNDMVQVVNHVSLPDNLEVDAITDNSAINQNPVATNRPGDIYINPNHVYILYNDKDDGTYVGYTNNPAHRIRQHNTEIKGGARFTSAKVRTKQCKWEYLALIRFDTPQFNKNVALSFEWQLKFEARIHKGYRSPKGRLDSINVVLNNRKFSHLREFANILVYPNQTQQPIT
jgi:predicted GIY-YIG superfamily endonuclease